MKLFDLHCDTAYEMKKQRKPLRDSDLMVSLKKAERLEAYKQVMAIWSDSAKSDEDCFKEYKLILGNLRHELEVENTSGFVISVEDARILAGKEERIYKLKEDKVDIVTPVWGGESCIGGAFDTEVGLTEFGKNAMSKFASLGMIADISHSSVKTAAEIMDIYERSDLPIIASHSCAYTVYKHPRNLRRDQFERIKASGGLVGLSFCRYHLSGNQSCGIDDILTHVDYFLSLGGEDTLCIGADMDGAPMPDGIEGLDSFPQVHNALENEFGSAVTEKITWSNANEFSKKHFNKI